MKQKVCTESLPPQQGEAEREKTAVEQGNALIRQQPAGILPCKQGPDGRIGLLPETHCSSSAAMSPGPDSRGYATGRQQQLTVVTK